MAVGRFAEVVVDSNDPWELAEFWRKLIGGSLDQAHADGDWVPLRDIPGLGVLAFQRVPERKAHKNRLHLDVTVDVLVHATGLAVELGASTVGAVVQQKDCAFQVLLDPAGNEFCLVQEKAEED